LNLGETTEAVEEINYGKYYIPTVSIFKYMRPNHNADPEAVKIEILYLQEWKFNTLQSRPHSCYG
jgi:hypothetical protein